MKEELIKYVMREADKCYSDDFPIRNIEIWINEFFDQYQPERSKREDYNYKCLELDGNASCDFIEVKRVQTKLEAEKWVDEKPHLRTWHAFVDAVL